jgi:hypothetical protein
VDQTLKKKPTMFHERKTTMPETKNMNIGKAIDEKKQAQTMQKSATISNFNKQVSSIAGEKRTIGLKRPSNAGLKGSFTGSLPTKTPTKTVSSIGLGNSRSSLTSSKALGSIEDRKSMPVVSKKIMSTTPKSSEKSKQSLAGFSER